MGRLVGSIAAAALCDLSLGSGRRLLRGWGGAWEMRVLLLLAALMQLASAYKLVIDSNTMTPDDLANASKGTLRADGSYSTWGGHGRKCWPERCWSAPGPWAASKVL